MRMRTKTTTDRLPPPGEKTDHQGDQAQDEEREQAEQEDTGRHHLASLIGAIITSTTSASIDLPSIACSLPARRPIMDAEIAPHTPL